MTKSLKLLSSPDLLADARAVLDTFKKRGGSVESSFLHADRMAWRMDVMASLIKAARAPKRHFGSFDTGKCLTWAATLGWTPEAVAAVVLVNAGELKV
jgi:hypothetical protein